MFIKKIILGLVSFSFITGNSQVGIANTSPQSTLDVRGVNHNGAVTAMDGILVPRVNDLIVSGNANGQLVYLISDVGNDKKGFYYWNTSRWYPFQVTASPMLSESIVLPDTSFTSNTTPTAFTNSVGSVLNNATSPYTKNFTVSGITGTTSLVTITINITHATDQDLDIFLQSPTGQILELTTDNGGTGNNYTNTVFSDAGATNITAGTAPFTGNFRPEGTLTASGVPVSLTATITTFAGFNGFNPNGVWALRFGDDINNGEAGNFVSATLNVSGTTVVDWVLKGEVSISYLSDTAIIVESSYSGDTTDLNGVITALTRSTSSAGASGTTSSTLPGTILNYASASPSGTGNFWVNTFNQTRSVGLLDNTTYYYQLWRKGNIETPIASNESFSIIPFRVKI